MSGFSAVNASLPATDSAAGTGIATDTPTTPRPSNIHIAQPTSQGAETTDDASSRTPTRDSFNGIVGQRPLPTAPFTPSQDPGKETAVPSTEPPRKLAVRESSHKHTKSLDAQDVDMMDDDDRDISDDESVDGDSNRPTKKKKGQRFFCTDFPPCQLSFTRSEHLARHIRKHTGERPFQCHCSRRFSRLDNLRQHAQTVHVNEDIPGDSLAATGTRFQRQIRTDRVRPPPSRSRGSTLSNAGAHSRGHSRNLSTSSIASTTSTISTISHISHDDFRQRPVTLAMASPSVSQRTPHAVDSFNPQLLAGSPGPTFYNPGPEPRPNNGYTTPPSASYSPATGSPRYSGLHSPNTLATRPLAYGEPSKSHTRRLSVPSAAAHNPFQPHAGPSGYPGSPYATPLSSASSSAFQSANGTGYTSPNPSSYSSQGDGDEWRRRTWHPTTQTGMRPASSGLRRFENADASGAPAVPPLPSMRLPGIESFDHAPPHPGLARLGSPMQVDPPGPQPAELGIQQGIRKLDIANPESSQPRGQWIQQHPPPAHPVPPPPHLPSLRHHENPAVQRHPPPQAGPSGSQQMPPSGQPQPYSNRYSDQPLMPRRNKRHGWVEGPVPTSYHQQDHSSSNGWSQYSNAAPQAHEAPHNQPRTEQNYQTSFLNTDPDSSDDEGARTPSSSRRSVNSGMYHPSASQHVAAALSHQQHAQEQRKPDISGWTMRNAQYEAGKHDGAGPYREEHHQQRDSGVGLAQPPVVPPAPVVDNGMRRLEALVAVATGEGRA